MKQWSIKAQPDNEETSYWILRHEPCAWESNAQESQSVADIMRWMISHDCLSEKVGITQLKRVEEAAINWAEMLKKLSKEGFAQDADKYFDQILLSIVAIRRNIEIDLSK